MNSQLRLSTFVATALVLGLAAPALAGRGGSAARIQGAAATGSVDAIIAEVERAVTEPPEDTRAYLRGRLVAERTSEVLGIDWSWILLQTRQGRRRLRLDDPLGSAAGDVRAAGGLDGLIATL